MNIKAALCALTFGMASFGGVAQAGIIVTAPADIVADSYLGTSPTAGFISSGPIDNPTSSIRSIAFNGAGSGVYSGTIATAHSPFGASDQDYLVAQPGGSVTIVLNAPSLTFSFVWGSVDGYNLFTDGAGSVTGADIAAADPAVVFGITSEPITLAFSQAVTTLTFSDTTASGFEFATATPVPEPMTAALLGTTLLGLGLIPRNRRT